ncbi:hypothetical protein GCM10011335_03490 [Aureimonas glaciei]|jgi:hypothetical protein|uniref:Uncharacterized protein n=1 Tax=Aureimonas glaciei TaxID=1776957 RepID=A0A916XSJ5_9HYPH|nr:hypothetical protein GCM10011335_03490 [Aureimonas glaciei]
MVTVVEGGSNVRSAAWHRFQVLMGVPDLQIAADGGIGCPLDAPARTDARSANWMTSDDR